MRALAFEANLAAHGLEATAELPDGTTVTGIRIIWLTTEAAAVPGAFDSQKVDPLRTLVIRRSDVPQVPRGTRITVPEVAGGDDKTWIVDSYERREADQHRCIVIRDPNDECDDDA